MTQYHQIALSIRYEAGVTPSTVDCTIWIPHQVPLRYCSRDNMVENPVFFDECMSSGQYQFRIRQYFGITAYNSRRIKILFSIVIEKRIEFSEVWIIPSLGRPHHDNIGLHGTVFDVVVGVPKVLHDQQNKRSLQYRMASDREIYALLVGRPSFFYSSSSPATTQFFHAPTT